VPRSCPILKKSTLYRLDVVHSCLRRPRHFWLGLDRIKTASNTQLIFTYHI
jgi:hypothetical protein